jgi:hypothetical protein
MCLSNNLTRQTLFCRFAVPVYGQAEITQMHVCIMNQLAEEKAEPDQAKLLLDRVQERLVNSGYEATQTAYGHFNDLHIEAKGHPLARIFKEF